MSDVVETTVEIPPVNEFLQVKDFEGKVLYTCKEEELEEVLVSILSTGLYNKTFSLFKGKIELTYQSITNEERAKGYKYIREFTEANQDKLSRIELENYTAKINISLQLTRLKTNGIATNMVQGEIDERLTLLSGQPEELVRLCSKYLGIFATITAKAFSSEDVLKK